MQETWVPTLGQEDSLEKGMAAQTNILAWRIHEQSLMSHSPWGHKELDVTERLTQCYNLCSFTRPV